MANLVVTPEIYEAHKHEPLIPGSIAWEVSVNTPKCYGCVHALCSMYGCEVCDIDKKHRNSFAPQFECKNHKFRSTF